MATIDWSAMIAARQEAEHAIENQAERLVKDAEAFHDRITQLRETPAELTPEAIGETLSGMTLALIDLARLFRDYMTAVVDNQTDT